MEEIWGIRNEGLMLLVDHVDGQDGVAAHIRVAVLEAGSDRRDKRLEDLGLLELAEEAKCAATNVLIRMLKIVPQGIANDQTKDSEVGSGILRLA